MLAGGMPVRVVGLTVGHFDTHAGQVATMQPRPRPRLGLAARVPARPRGARHRRPRARARVVGVRPPRRRERVRRHRPRRRRASASSIGSKLTGKQIGSHPGVSGGLDAQGNLKPSADFRAVYSAILEQWLDVDANDVIPGVAAFKRPDPAQVRRAALAALVAVGAALAVVPAQAAEVPIKITRVQVSGKEFFYALSRAHGRRRARRSCEFVNFGEDPHDMRIRRVGGTHTYRTPLVQPGRLLRPRAEARCPAATSSGAASRTTRRSG